MHRKQSDAWALGWFVAACLALMMVSGWQALRAEIISTTDGLSMNVNAEGRVTGLTMDGQSLALSGHGGFYVRDNTLGENGLPGNAENLLECADFQENCGTCFADPESVVWRKRANSIFTLFECHEILIPGGQPTTTAKVQIHELTSGPYYAIFFQDVSLDPASEHELYYLTFDLATECGWRSYIHPADHQPGFHGSHSIQAMIEWFAGTTPLDEITPQPDSRAIAVSTVYAYETSTNLTRFALESYRPLAPQPATRARIKIVVEGFMPNDGRNETLEEYNYALFDNFAFYKAPPIQEVYGTWPYEGYAELFTYVDDERTPLGISMKSSAHGNTNHILLHAELRNDHADDQITRQLDFGFALPISEDDQELKWWDDGNSPVLVSATDTVKTYPFRFAPSADTRSTSINEHKLPTGGPLKEKPFRQRGEDTRISAYPFSALTIVKSGQPYGLSFGDDLLSSPLTISNFGYRVKRITEFEGTYYIEFALGMLARAADPDPDQPDASFGFVLFRSDDSTWAEVSTFKKAAEKYEHFIFPSFFTRPLNSGDDWRFGGGVFPPQEGDSDGFDNLPEEFGLRFSNSRYLDTTTSRDAMIAGINWFGPEVCISAYDAPWAAFFHNPDTTGSLSDMNTHHRLTTSMGDHNPDTAPGWPDGPFWNDIYQAKKANALRMPSVPATEQTPPVSLFSRHIDSRPSGVLETYSFPALLADPPIGDAGLVSEELRYVTKTYEDVSNGSKFGIDGPMYDNVFYDQDRADHFDVPDDSFFQKSRLREFLNAGFTLSYSNSYLQPAIPQLALNTSFLEQVRAYLHEIDENPGLFWGDGTEAVRNRRDEVLAGNMNDPSYGGSKHGIMRADLFGFESSPVLDSNNDAQAFNFRRTLARDKNVARVFSFFPCIEEMLGEGWSLCEAEWSELWVSWENLFRQIANEAIWMALAWGFHPDLVALFPGSGDPDSYLDGFVDDYLRPIFAEDHGPGLGYTNIFKALHLAGWRPITSAVPHKGNPTNPDDILPLHVERFGDGPLTTEQSARYFTVLNNDSLEFTIVQIVNMVDIPPSEFTISEIPDLQTLEDRQGCGATLLDCDQYPEQCPGSSVFLNRQFYLDIYNPNRFGLWNGNLHGVQLVYEEGNHPQVCNWPEIVDAAFNEGSEGDNVYSIKRLLGSPQRLRIGGIWGSTQEMATIPNKALMVFKLWGTFRSDNGEGGSASQQGSESSDDGQAAAVITPFYERYGDGWQTLATESAVGGTVDAVEVGSPEAVVVYKINVAASGLYNLQVHFPQSAEAAPGAFYQVYLLDYTEGPVGSSEPGSPILTTLIDQADSEAYESAMDDEGYISLGTLDLDVADGEEVKTLVCRLSCDSAGSMDLEGSVLLADAVRLVQLD